MRILCIGNNTEHTDHMVHDLAAQYDSQCHGLLCPANIADCQYYKPGFYHTTVVDIEYGQLLILAKNFDQLIILDQPRHTYNHADFFYNTVRLGIVLERSMPVTWQNPAMKKSIVFFQQLVETNKAFCIFPFIELLTNNDHTTVCCRSTTAVTPIQELKNFNTDQRYKHIRQNMIQGIVMPNHCHSCYKQEHLGMVSARQQETVEWANRLNINSLEDLQKIHKPVYYEIRPSNRCNLQCRMCVPSNSELINQEYFKLGLISKPVKLKHSGFDIVDLESVKKLYVAGGEPTVMPEFYQFLDQCISQKRNFEFTVNTNATKLSEKFKKQLAQLPHVQFIVSIDGYKDLNHYIRWPSDWETVINNVQYLCENKHVVSFNVTVSIYNVAELYPLLSFFDQQFPGRLVRAQLAGGITSPLNFPAPDLVLINLKQIRELKCYQNDRLLSSLIESLIQHFEQSKSPADLTSFLEFNQKLDTNRNISLQQYATVLWSAISRSRLEPIQH